MPAQKYRLSECEIKKQFIHKVLIPKRLQRNYSLSPFARAFRLSCIHDDYEWRFEYPLRLLRLDSADGDKDNLIMLCSDKEKIILERYEGAFCVEEREVTWQELEKLLMKTTTADIEQQKIRLTAARMSSALKQAS